MRNIYRDVYIHRRATRKYMRQKYIREIYMRDVYIHRRATGRYMRQKYIREIYMRNIYERRIYTDEKYIYERNT